MALPASNVTGQWDFDSGDLSASVGSPLAYLDGEEGVTKAGTLFGTTGEGDLAAVPNIGDAPAEGDARAERKLDRNIGYVVTHRIAPNGGDRVNQYTLVIDLFVGHRGPGCGVAVADQFGKQHR